MKKSLAIILLTALLMTACPVNVLGEIDPEKDCIQSFDGYQQGITFYTADNVTENNNTTTSQLYSNINELYQLFPTYEVLLCMSCEEYTDTIPKITYVSDTRYSISPSALSDFDAIMVVRRKTASWSIIEFIGFEREPFGGHLKVRYHEMLVDQITLIDDIMLDIERVCSVIDTCKQKGDLLSATLYDVVFKCLYVDATASPYLHIKDQSIYEARYNEVIEIPYDVENGYELELSIGKVTLFYVQALMTLGNPLFILIYYNSETTRKNEANNDFEARLIYEEMKTDDFAELQNNFSVLMLCRVDGNMANYTIIYSDQFQPENIGLSEASIHN